MAIVDDLAAFAAHASYDDLSPEARIQLKIRVLDALGCALGALHGGPIQAVREQVEDLGGRPLCTLIGGGRTAPDRAAFYNGALVRYLDFNDAYLAKGETGHPSDNLGAVLAAAEYAGKRGRDLLAALAVAYQVQCRLSDAAPVRARGFDHTTQGAYAAAAGVARALGLDPLRTAHAVAISGTAYNALRVSRTGALSQWKGLAYPNTAFGATHAALLAMRGVTGPREVFEGNKGFMEAIAGRFEIDWRREDLERVRRTIVKRFNAEIHAQSAIEGAIELKQEHGLEPGEVDRVELEIFEVAFHIIGGGEEGDKTVVATKEEADHSLPYLVAVALLDGRVMPEQLTADRICADDVQVLLRRVAVAHDPELSRRFPGELGCRIRVRLRNGQILERAKRDYAGFVTRPPTWEATVHKFDRLSGPFVGRAQRDAIVGAVSHLEEEQVSDFTRLLALDHEA